MFTNSTTCGVVTGVSGGECGVLPPVNTELMVKSLRDVFHLPRGPRDAGNKEIVRRFIGEYFRNMSSISSEALVHEQSFHVPDRVMLLSSRQLY